MSDAILLTRQLVCTKMYTEAHDLAFNKTRRVVWYGIRDMVSYGVPDAVLDEVWDQLEEDLDDRV